MPHVELPQAEFKVVILGDTNTGKTSLVLRFVSGHYKAEARSATVGAFFLTKRITVDAITCKMLIWDTAGQQQFQKLAKTYYSNAAAAILAYDVTQPSSLLKLTHWLEELQKNTVGRRIVICIAACKCDLVEHAAPGLQDEAQRLARSCGALYAETSAKDNVGVHQLFSDAASRVLQWQAEAATGSGPPIPVTVAGGHNSGGGGGAGATAITRARTSPNKRTTAAPSSASAAATANAPASVHHPIAASSTPETDPSETADPAGDDVIVETSAAGATEQPAKPASSNVICEGSLMVCGTDDRSCCIM